MNEIRALLESQSQERAKLQDYLADLQKKIQTKDDSCDSRLSALEQKCAYLEADRKILIERITRLESQNVEAQGVVWKLVLSMNELQHSSSGPK